MLCCISGYFEQVEQCHLRALPLCHNMTAGTVNESTM